MKVPRELKRRLNILAKQTHRPRNFYVIKALEALLDEKQDIFLAEAVSERIQNGQEKTYTLEEVLTFLDHHDTATMDD